MTTAVTMAITIKRTWFAHGAHAVLALLCAPCVSHCVLVFAFGIGVTRTRAVPLVLVLEFVLALVCAWCAWRARMVGHAHAHQGRAGGREHGRRAGDALDDDVEGQAVVRDARQPADALGGWR